MLLFVVDFFERLIGNDLNGGRLCKTDFQLSSTPNPYILLPPVQPSRAL